MSGALSRLVGTRRAIEWEDRFRYSAAVRWALCQWKLARTPRCDDTDAQGLAKAIEHLCGAARMAPHDDLLHEIEGEIMRLAARLGRQRFDWGKFEPASGSKAVEKGIVLKPWVSEREKGVVFISFESQVTRLLRHVDLEAFARRYLLVMSPSWSRPHCLLLAALPQVHPGPIFTLVSNPEDLGTFARLSPRYVPVPLYASNWVNPDWVKPLPFERKDIDLVMVANFGKFKRHHALFKALRQMSPQLKLVLIGQHDGPRTREVFLAEAAAFGVAGRFELRESVPHAGVLDTLRRAKVSVILSLREGSCVVVTESLFANTPVGLLEDAAIGSRVFINAATGRFLKHADLGLQLMQFITEAQNFQPRRWALDNNISCFGSTARLNQILKDHQLAAGQEWTTDLAPLHWRPNPEFVHAHDRERMKPAFEDVRQRFGVEIGMPRLYEM